MKKLVIYFIFSLVIGVKTYAQKPDIQKDKLLNQYLDLGYEFCNKSDLDSVNFYISKIDSLLKLSEFDSTDYYCKKVLEATLAVKTNDASVAIKNLLEAETYFEETKDSANYALVLTKLANANYYMNRRLVSLDYLAEAKQYEKHFSKRKWTIIHQNIGAIMLELAIIEEDRDSLIGKAILSFNEAILIYRKENWEDELSLATSLLAECYTQLEEYDKSLELLDESIFIAAKSKNEAKKGFALIKKANVLGLKNESDNGLKVITEAKKIFETLDDKHTLLYALFEEKKILINLKKYEEATKIGDKIYTLSQQVYNIRFADKVSEMDAKYKVAIKEKKISAQKEELLKGELKRKSQNIYLILLCFAFVILGLLYYFYYKRSKLKREQLRKELELKDAISQIKTQNELQEQRLRISRDLHDNIGSQLTFIISSIENLKFVPKITSEKLKDKLSNISLFTNSTISQLRDTIWAMNKNEITFEDFNGRVMGFIEKAKLLNEKIEFNLYTDVKSNIVFSSIKGISLFRIIQEAINNSMKYSEASKIDIIITENEHTLNLSILDNGKGFDKEKVKMGNGLSNMQKRVNEIGGKFEINSVLGEGTSVNITCNKNTTKSVL